jgi:hypothetical protein
MSDVSDHGLSPAETHDLRAAAGMMIPASEEFGVPGAGDPLIFADILKSLGRDLGTVRAALASLSGLAERDPTAAETALTAFHQDGGATAATFGRVILQCYYRDDRVIRSLGLEPRAPFPLGHTLEQGDWSLLDPVRARPKMWRDAP